MKRTLLRESEAARLSEQASNRTLHEELNKLDASVSFPSGGLLDRQELELLMVDCRKSLDEREQEVVDLVEPQAGAVGGGAAYNFRAS